MRGAIGPLSVVLACVVFAAAAVNGSSPPGACSAAGDPHQYLSQTYLRSVADSLFDLYMHDGRCPLPGGLLVVVCSDSTILSRGYGSECLEGRIPFDPDSSVVHIASVSKLVTAIAVMQLVERGTLVTDEDVRPLLEGIRIESRYDVPITIGNLLTHTAGFERRVIGTEFSSCEDTVGLAPFLALGLPRITWRPGTIYNYSDHGTALLALLVERAAGMPFHLYVQRRVFEPLGMAHSSFACRPGRTAVRYSCGGRLGADSSVPIPWTGTRLVGAAGLTTTAADMALFLKACLGCASYGFETILRESTLNEMLRTRFSYHAELGRSIGYAWHIERRNGVEIYYHIGAIPGLASYLALVPSLDIGVFFGANGDAGHRLRRDLMDALFATGNRPAPPRRGSTDTRSLAGFYLPTELPEETIEKLSRLTAGGITVRAAEGDTLLAAGVSCIEVEPSLFSSMNGDTRIFFFRGEGGELFCTTGLRTYRRVSWSESRAFHAGLLLACSLTMASSLLWPLERWRKGTRREPGSAAREILSAACLLVLLFLGILAVALRPDSLALGIPFALKAIFALPILAIAVAVVPVLYGPRFIADGRTRARTRLHYALVILAFAAVVSLLRYWNLIGFDF